MRELSFWQMMNHYAVRIPIIQRDYAQGRTSGRVCDVRKQFLHNLHAACCNREPLRLDFVYGEINGHEFIPFDGQQRLTTLFLLHWYAATRAGVLKDQVALCFGGFRYEVREGVRLFVQKLIGMGIDEQQPALLPHDASRPEALAAHIRDQTWFRAEWQLDPSISGMLVMLDAIHALFHNLDDLWGRLTGDAPPVTFYFETLSDLALSADESFIKMNARGKQLTDFEHFKARFINHLGACNLSQANDMAHKFDNEWINLFWTSFARSSALKNETQKNMAKVSDDHFVVFLRYMASLLLSRPLVTSDGTGADAALPDTDRDDLFDCLREAVRSDRQPIHCDSNLAFLTAVLTMLATRASAADPGSACKGLEMFFQSFFVILKRDALPVAGKIALFSDSVTEVNLFIRCCQASPFSQADRLLFFACLLFIMEDMEEPVARLRLRMLRNILEHSTNELREMNFADQLLEVRTLILDGTLGERTAFNTHQVLEEQAKLLLRQSHKHDDELLEALDYLEDHPLLCGRLALFSHDDAKGRPVLFAREALVQGQHLWALAFGMTPVNYDAVIRGLLSQGDYTYRLGDQRRYLGSAPVSSGKITRRTLFTTLDERSFGACRKAVQALAQKTAICVDTPALETALHALADSWVAECKNKGQMDWRYYFVKYEKMRPQHTELSVYFWGYHQQSFNQLKLMSTTRLSQNWSPFLCSAMGEAKIDASDYTGIRSSGQESMPLEFPWCNLALWWGEFSWHLCSPDGTHKLDSQQAQDFDSLRSQFADILDDKGWVFIPGEDSAQDVDYTAPAYHHYRVCDKVDRIALITPLIKALYELAQ